MNRFNYDGAYEYMKLNLKKSRFDHSHRVMEMAVLLAEKHGVDVEKARIAGLFHDIRKNVGKDEGRTILKDLGVTDSFLLSNPNLAHGHIGGEFLKCEFGLVDEDIYNAIKNHTFGRIGMSTLEKVIYVADYVERGRAFPKREFFEELAFEDIDRAYYEICKNTLKYLVDNNRQVHPVLVEIINDYIENNIS